MPGLLYAPEEPLRLFMHAAIVQGALSSTGDATATWKLSSGSEYVTLTVSNAGEIGARLTRSGEAGMWLQIARELAPWIGAQLELNGVRDSVVLTARFSFA